MVAVELGADFHIGGRAPVVADLWEAPAPWGPHIVTAIKVPAMPA